MYVFHLAEVFSVHFYTVVGFLPLFGFFLHNQSKPWKVCSVCHCGISIKVPNWGTHRQKHATVIWTVIRLLFKMYFHGQKGRQSKR